MIWTAFEVLINFYQGFLIIRFFRKRFGQNEVSRWIDVGFMIAAGAMLTFHQFADTVIPDYSVFLIALVYAKWLSQERWAVCMLWTMIELIAFMGTITLIGFLFNTLHTSTWAVLEAQTSLHLAFVVCTNLALTLVTSVAAKIGQKKSAVSHGALALFSALLILCFVINECLYLLQVGDHPDTYTTAASLCTLGIVFLSVALYELMNMSVIRERRAKLALQTASMVQQHQEELQGIYTHMLREQHDLRHRIALAQELLSQTDSTSAENRERAIQLLHEPENFDSFITGNTAMDALLKAKSAMMKQEGIQFEYVPYPLRQLPIPEQAFCVLISNLLDNAIEGVMRLPPGTASRKVRLAFAKNWDMFSVTCVNDANGKEIRHRGNVFRSSKDHPEIHGFGTLNMRHIVESNGGVIEFIVRPREFRVEIMLPEGGKAECSGALQRHL